jgi:hypothetical protein
MKLKKFFYPGYKTMFVVFGGIETAKANGQFDLTTETFANEFGEHFNESKFEPLAKTGDGLNFKITWFNMDEYKAAQELAPFHCVNEGKDLWSAMELPDVIFNSNLADRQILFTHVDETEDNLAGVRDLLNYAAKQLTKFDLTSAEMNVKIEDVTYTVKVTR